ncbi:MAG: hypothetical protein AAF850_05400 [Pseudomonadota bacterium]
MNRSPFAGLAAVLLSLSALLFSSIGAALAAEAPALTEERAMKFIDSLEGAMKLGEEMKEEDVSIFEGRDDVLDGDLFSPYSMSLRELKDENPSMFNRVNAFARKSGFKNALDWGATGDALFLAYAALNVPPNTAQMLAQMQAMSPDMLNMLPPAQRQGYDRAMQMLRALEAIPASDRDVVAAVRSELDAALIKLGDDAGFLGDAASPMGGAMGGGAMGVPSGLSGGK